MAMTPNMVSAVNSGANQIASMNGVAQANSAFNAEQARLQREWTEQQTAKAMEFNAAEAQKNRDWQEMMSNSAHQREIKDLMAAGLNPILSAMNGNGASVGSGATASSVVGSGSKADADTSGSAAIANLLGSILSAQTAIEAANVSARTQEAVADKYTAMSEIVANINAGASRYSADAAKAASMFASQNTSSAARYSADQSRAASEYSSDRLYQTGKENRAQEWASNQQYGNSKLTNVLGRMFEGLNYGFTGVSARDYYD